VSASAARIRRVWAAAATRQLAHARLDHTGGQRVHDGGHHGGSHSSGRRPTRPRLCGSARSGNGEPVGDDVFFFIL